MQAGIILKDAEIKQLIAARAGELTNQNPDELTVHVSTYNLRDGSRYHEACVFHADGVTNIALKEGGAS